MIYKLPTDTMSLLMIDQGAEFKIISKVNSNSYFTLSSKQD